MVCHNFDGRYVARALVARSALPVPTTRDEAVAHALIASAEPTQVRFAGAFDSVGERQLHYGIVPEYKAISYKSEYRRLFLEHVPTFVGVSANLFCDWTAYDWTATTLAVVMVSLGSWNHRWRRYLPTVRGRFAELAASLGVERVEPYRLARSDVVTVFVQNFHPREYWFGWSDADMEEWIARETRVIALVRAHTERRVMVRFHPKLAARYETAFKAALTAHETTAHETTAHETVGCWERERTISEVCRASRCVVINSGFSVAHACVLGTPVFYVNDDLSNLPMAPFATSDLTKLDTFEPKDLPDQTGALDFLASQLVEIDRLGSVALEHTTARPAFEWFEAATHRRTVRGFDYYRIDEAFPPRLHDAMEASFPTLEDVPDRMRKVSGGGNRVDLDLRWLHYAVTDPEVDALIRELTSLVFFRRMCERFGVNAEAFATIRRRHDGGRADVVVDLQYAFNPSTDRTTPSFLREPHVDSPDKLFVLLLYFPERDEKKQRERAKEQSHHTGGDLILYETKDGRPFRNGTLQSVARIDRLPYRSNTGILFENSSAAVHAPECLFNRPRECRRFLNVIWMRE